MSTNILNVTDASFEADVLKASGVTLVDFWAPWCSPCKVLAPLLEELASDYQGEIRIAKINSEDNKVTSEQPLVRGLPTLILFNEGLEVERVVGIVTKGRLANLIDKHLGA